MSGNVSAAAGGIRATIAAGTSPFIKRSIAMAGPPVNCTSVAPAATIAVLILPLEAMKVSSSAMVFPVKSETEVIFRRATTTAIMRSTLSAEGEELLRSEFAAASATSSSIDWGRAGISRGCEDEEAAPLPPVLSDAAGRAAVVLGSGLAGVTGPAILGVGSGTRDPPLSRFAVLGGGGIVCAAPSAAACLDGDFARFAT